MATGSRSGCKKALLAARRHVERDLRASEAQFHRLFIAAPVGIAISKPDGPIVRTNPRLWELLGYSEGELSELQLSELFSPDDLPTLQRLYQRLLDGQELRIREEFLLRRKDGEWTWSYLAASVLRDSEQRPRYLVTMVGRGHQRRAGRAALPGRDRGRGHREHRHRAAAVRRAAGAG